tara:strand:- start:344 stop:850 length:507 start_codon:yes stop_codon:yes gene_type:complete
MNDTTVLVSLSTCTDRDEVKKQLVDYAHVFGKDKLKDLLNIVYIEDEGSLPCTLLVNAMHHGLLDVAEELIEFGADPNVPADGLLPLHYFCMYNSSTLEERVKFAEFILQHMSFESKHQTPNFIEVLCDYTVKDMQACLSSDEKEELVKEAKMIMYVMEQYGLKINKN